MKSSLSAVHLVRTFALFTLVVLFLLTLTRAGFSLWLLNHIESVQGFNDLKGFKDLFILGWRFDLALIGTVLLIPVTVGTFLAILGPLRILARIIIHIFLVLGMLLILVTELITPYFLHISQARPDFAELKALGNPVEVLASLWSTQMIPLIIGLVLSLLILIAFMVRLEMSRFLRHRIRPFSGILLIVVGGALCLFAIISNVDFIEPPLVIPTVLHPNDSLISTDKLVNDLSMNSAFKLGWSVVPEVEALIKPAAEAETPVAQ